MTVPVHYLPITELSQQLRAGELTAVQLVTDFIQRTESLNDTLHAIITLNADSAIAAAERADEVLRQGAPSNPLTGIPITIKDVIPTRGIRTTYNSRLKMDWIPDDEPRAITKLRDAGAILLGKANANEFLGIPSEDDRFPRPRSPYNTDYVSIGSSSGSGVAVAAGFCAASIGTDGAGSVRLPAGQHGLVGMKATNGRITRYGMGSASSLQVLGPLARSVEDAALITQVLAGYEPSDPDSWPQPVPDYRSELVGDLNGWKIGVPWRYIETAPVEPEIRQAFDRALENFRGLGAEIVPIAIPGLAHGRMATFVVLYTEHHFAHALWTRTEADKYGPSARLYAMQGAFISALDYLNAREYGRQLRRIVQKQFPDVRAIAMPTSPFVTAEAARKPSEHRQGINTVFTGPFNLTGHPAITIPCGRSSLGIPIGLQLVGSLYDELSLFRLSYAYEQATEWHLMYPEILDQ